MQVSGRGTRLSIKGDQVSIVMFSAYDINMLSSSSCSKPYGMTGSFGCSVDPYREYQLLAAQEKLKHAFGVPSIPNVPQMTGLGCPITTPTSIWGAVETGLPRVASPLTDPFAVSPFATSGRFQEGIQMRSGLAAPFGHSVYPQGVSPYDLCLPMNVRGLTSPLQAESYLGYGGLTPSVGRSVTDLIAFQREHLKKDLLHDRHR